MRRNLKGHLRIYDENALGVFQGNSKMPVKLMRSLEKADVLNVLNNFLFTRKSPSSFQLKL
jgi:hypothetical protein